MIVFLVGIDQKGVNFSIFCSQSKLYPPGIRFIGSHSIDTHNTLNEFKYIGQTGIDHPLTVQFVLDFEIITHIIVGILKSSLDGPFFTIWMLIIQFESMNRFAKKSARLLIFKGVGAQYSRIEKFRTLIFTEQISGSTENQVVIFIIQKILLINQLILIFGIAGCCYFLAVPF